VANSSRSDLVHRLDAGSHRAVSGALNSDVVLAKRVVFFSAPGSSDRQSVRERTTQKWKKQKEGAPDT